VDDEHELEVIRERMEETRTALGDKVDVLENTILGTVQTATSAVADTVETVKETVAETVETVKEKVEDTVESVKDTFNVRKHVERHPWLALGCSVATGFLAGRWLLGSSEEKWETQGPPIVPPPEESPARSYTNGAAHTNGHSASQEEEEEQEGESPLAEGLKLIKGLALGSVMGLVRDLVLRTAPQSVVGDVNQFVNDMTDRLGGKRLWEGESDEAATGEGSHAERESSEMGRSMGTARW
jgi:ElaB/YqjD/DUF883 family membrane-anchored ribosome-binding protein